MFFPLHCRTKHVADPLFLTAQFNFLDIPPLGEGEPLITHVQSRFHDVIWENKCLESLNILVSIVLHTWFFKQIFYNSSFLKQWKLFERDTGNSFEGFEQQILNKSSETPFLDRLKHKCLNLIEIKALDESRSAILWVKRRHGTQIECNVIIRFSFVSFETILPISVTGRHHEGT